MPQDFRVHVTIIPNGLQSSYDRSFAVRAPNKIFALKAVIQKYSYVKIDVLAINTIIKGAWEATEECVRLKYQPTQADLHEWLEYLGFELAFHPDQDTDLSHWIDWENQIFLIIRPGSHPVMLKGSLDDATLDQIAEMNAGIFAGDPAVFSPQHHHD